MHFYFIRFYTCLDGKAYRKSCAPGLFFNAHIGQCQLPATWNFCQNNGPTIIPHGDINLLDESTQAPWPENTLVVTESTPLTKTTTIHPLWNKELLMQRIQGQNIPAHQLFMKATPSTTETPTPIIDCSVSDGAFPHPDSCTKFLRCLGGKLSSVNCRATYYWHQEKNRCFPQKPAHC